ncbi:hypothetical protein MVEG_01028 [Podila verticillata NRRL 6337]|nr:hypothetical protein MVEG_01028 [Podila verticillata NRRL 6337]
MSRFSANFTTAHGKKRKQELGQHDSSRLPDIVECTAGDKEIYYGELKGIYATKQDVNVDILRVDDFCQGCPGSPALLPSRGSSLVNLQDQG